MGQFRGVELTDLHIPGDRVLLRPWRPDDATDLAAALASGEVHRVLALPAPYTTADAVQFATYAGHAERRDGTGVDCAVAERASGRLVGSASLRLPVGMRACAVGCWIAPSAQGNGYATDATRALARWAHGHGVHRVEFRLDVTDIASAHAALRAGFGFEGLRRDALPVADGRRDLAVFVRLPDDPDRPIPPTFPPLPGEQLSDGTLTLRAPLPDDIDGFAEQEADPLTRHAGFTGSTPARRVMQRLLDRGRLDLLVAQTAGFSMVECGTGSYAGSVRVRVVGPPNVGGIGYVVHPAFRGRGYAARALCLLAEWAFADHHFARLELGAKVHNVASQRVALCAGFEPDGTWRARLRNADGTFSDEARFSRVNPRYA